MSIAERLEAIRTRIARAEADAGRAGGSVRLIAVSKGHGHEAIREAYAAGQRLFGENYVQEMATKAEIVGALEGLSLHAIGNLQRNKVKDVVLCATTIHTVDRAELADEIQKRTRRPIDVLLEVNLAREPQKGGCAPEALDALADHVSKLDRLRLVGLMGMPPATADEAEARAFFRSLASVARGLRDRGLHTVEHLSMGMSHDFEVAIAEGATMVRVGTAIFGERSAKAD